jgi:hypothetical protein
MNELHLLIPGVQSACFIRLGHGHNKARLMIQGTFGVIQGTFDVIQGTFGVILWRERCAAVKIGWRTQLLVACDHDWLGDFGLM